MLTLLKCLASTRAGSWVRIVRELQHFRTAVFIHHDCFSIFTLKQPRISTKQLANSRYWAGFESTEDLPPIWTSPFLVPVLRN